MPDQQRNPDPTRGNVETRLLYNGRIVWIDGEPTRLTQVRETPRGLEFSRRELTPVEYSALGFDPDSTRAGHPEGSRRLDNK